MEKDPVREEEGEGKGVRRKERLRKAHNHKREREITSERQRGGKGTVEAEHLSNSKRESCELC